MWLLAFDLQRTTEFRPLHDRVVVRRIEEDMKTTGGIIIPDTAKEKPMQGKVIAVGPGARDDCGKLVPLDVKKGDRVLFGNPLTRRSVARVSWGFTFWSDDSPATSR